MKISKPDIIKAIVFCLAGLLLILVISLVIFMINSTLISQEKSKDIIATTEDGEKVLLKASGTWEYLEETALEKSDLLKEIKSWMGQGIKKTESFEVTTNEWAIVWATIPVQNGFPGIFQIFVYKENGDMVDMVANVVGESSDNLRMQGKGKYSLEINTNQLWKVGVFEINKEKK